MKCCWRNQRRWPGSPQGNVFNHATDRVPSLDDLVAQQRRLGRPLKDTIETSRSGRVRQTAFRADPVQREFIDSSGAIFRRSVPGSFRVRSARAVLGTSRLDLAFGSGNALTTAA
jgi:hypothetical protein